MHKARLRLLVTLFALVFVLSLRPSSPAIAQDFSRQCASQGSSQFCTCFMGYYNTSLSDQEKTAITSSKLDKHTASVIGKLYEVAGTCLLKESPAPVITDATRPNAQSIAQGARIIGTACAGLEKSAIGNVVGPKAAANICQCTAQMTAENLQADVIRQLQVSEIFSPPYFSLYLKNFGQCIQNEITHLP